MTVPTQYIKSEYFGGPLDGDRRRADASIEYYASADTYEVHGYHRRERGMDYSGWLHRNMVPRGFSVRELRVGLER